jgi:P pilus assembly chaperone PapD
LTNLFQYVAQQTEKVFIYKVQTIPPIKPDATKTWYKLINSIKFQLEREIKMITFRADTVWGEVEKQTFSTTTVLDRKKKPQQK